jgi:hypothetical protein
VCIGEADAPVNHWDPIIPKVGLTYEQVRRAAAPSLAAESGASGGARRLGGSRWGPRPFNCVRVIGAWPATCHPKPHPPPFKSPPSPPTSQSLIILSTHDLMDARMQQLHQERQQLCQRLGELAGAEAANGGGAAAVPPPRAANGGAPGAAAGGGGSGCGAAARFDSFTEQSEIADQIAANTARMGSLLQLHMAALYSILTDVQRARLCVLAFPVPPNAAKCTKSLKHVLTFTPERVPSGAAVDLAAQMACWARAGAPRPPCPPASGSTGSQPRSGGSPLLSAGGTPASPLTPGSF